MRVRWQQIDPRVAAKAGTRLRSVAAHESEVNGDVATLYSGSSYPPVTETSKASEATEAPAATNSAAASAATVSPLRRAKPEERLEPIWSVLSLVTAACVVTLYGAICFASLAGPFALLLLTLLPVGCVATMAAASLPPPPTTTAALHARPLNTRPLRGVLSGSDELLRRALLPAPAETGVSRAEQLYGEVVCLLIANRSGARGQTGRQAQTLLKECNTLLAEYRLMETQTQRVRAFLAQETDAAVESERSHLASRLAEETDVIARRALHASLGLCEERQESVQSLGPLLARLEAHQEVICQALALAHAALAREHAAPAALQPPDVTLLRQTVRGITHRTRAMEEAVTDLTEG